MRHLAWLHATPEGAKKSRLATFREESEDHQHLRLPDLDEYGAAYIVGLLQEAGLMSSSGMGPLALSWTEIDSWLRCTGLDLSTWEKLTLKSLSEEYVTELVAAKERNRLAPYSPEPPEELDRVAIQDKILRILRPKIKVEDPLTKE